MSGVLAASGKALSGLLLSGLLTHSAQAASQPLDEGLRALISHYGLSGDPAQGMGLPDIHSPEAQLGKRLFFSRSLSGNLDMACASCHHPLLGGGDQLSLPIGPGVTDPEQLGLGRSLWGDAPPNEPRNAPTTFNVGLWRQHLFHDGRIEMLLGGKNKTPSDVYSNHAALNKTVGIATPDVPHPRPDHWAGQTLAQAQARFPLVTAEEMRGSDFNPTASNHTYRSKLAARLGGYGPLAHLLPKAVTAYWVDAFRQVFKTPDAPASAVVTEQNISFLLGEYGRSQRFTDNHWNRYVKGDTQAISTQAKQGALLFFRQPGAGGFGCTNCHQGNLFSDDQFHNMLIPPLGPGKAGGGVRETGEDKGRYLVSQQAEDLYRFRTPSLLNVAVTGPWGHNGAYTTLEGMVRHMLSPHQQALAYSPDQLQQTNIQTRHADKRLAEVLAHSEGHAEQQASDGEVAQLLAFLHTLTDPCVQDPACLQPWLPDDNEPDGIAFKLPAATPAPD